MVTLGPVVAVVVDVATGVGFADGCPDDIIEGVLADSASFSTDVSGESLANSISIDDSFQVPSSPATLSDKLPVSDSLMLIR